MATKKTRKTPDAKARWMSQARKVAEVIRHYAAFGYVTDVELWEDDDRKLATAIDRLYDAQRRAGLSEDSELTSYRMALREQWSSARNGAARIARAELYEGKARGLRASVPEGMQGYLDELKISRAKGQL
jgi:hypothetical protein